MAADVLRLIEALLAELYAVHARIQAADERADEAVIKVAAVRDTLRWERDRRRAASGDDTQ